ILKSDVMAHMDKQESEGATPAAKTEAAAVVTPAGARPEQRVPMTRLRARIAERLIEAQSTAAILTTFNEVNLQAIMDIRKQHQDAFVKAHDIKLGFMSFFVKATIEALKKFPAVNASIDGNDVIYHGYYDIGVAVGSPRGLVVTVLRDADQMTLAGIENKIKEFGQRAADGSLTYEELNGGTFTISNGGVFGSMLSTPILNPPQSGILGMHNIIQRPIAENGEVVIRPMMYLAHSYDHRIIDGREAVQFLISIKEALEDPARMLLDI
ncbi:2-oxoglutarate dehydrogenase complex dihydrolipoyllysine-residue succinyltransferase, partial [Solemya velum gill symbiont]